MKNLGITVMVIGALIVLVWRVDAGLVVGVIGYIVFNPDVLNKITSRRTPRDTQGGKTATKTLITIVALVILGLAVSICVSGNKEAPSATLPTLAQVKTQMKEDNPGMSLHEFQQLRVATGLSHILELHKNIHVDSARYLADGTVCYEYIFTDTTDWQTTKVGVLTTDGLLYADSVNVWRDFCKDQVGEEMVEAHD